MKIIKLKIFLLTFTLFTSIIGRAQTATEIFNAFSTQNYDILKGYMDNNLDVCIEEVQQFNKKEVAITRLKDYFSKNPIIKLENQHQGESLKNASKFHIAKLQTKKGVMRLFIYLENGSPKNLLKEIRVEKF